MLQRFQKTYHEYPNSFWVLMLGIFIDRLGGALIFPFISLFVTARFNVGMTEVGYVYAIFTVFALGGSFIGGALTDKFGRRTMMLFGLVFSGLSSLALIFVQNMTQLYLVGSIIGFLGNFGGPAAEAMIADLLPEKQRTEGYGIFRIVSNLSVTFGPLIGGFLAEYSYDWLFILDAITSAITALIVWFVIAETKPQRGEGEQEETIAESVGGYGKVFQDMLYMAFIGVTMLSGAVYMQMSTTLSVYMRDIAGLPVTYFGYLLSMNALMVVLLQFWFTRRISDRKPMVMMTLGTALYAIGFGIFGFGLGMGVFIVGMVILTIGEMIVTPVSTTLVSKFAPEHMRGRYLAVSGLGWVVPSAVAPLLAGVVMDQLNPHWLWYGCLVIGLIATAGYYLIHLRAGRRLALQDQPDKALS